jgi:hypothetical protein
MYPQYGKLKDILMKKGINLLSEPNNNNDSKGDISNASVIMHNGILKVNDNNDIITTKDDNGNNKVFEYHTNNGYSYTHMSIN